MTLRYFGAGASCTAAEPDDRLALITSPSDAGHVGPYVKHNMHTSPGGKNKFRADTTWTSDGLGKPYISATVTTYDLGQSYAASKRVEQVQDTWVN